MNHHTDNSNNSAMNNSFLFERVQELIIQLRRNESIDENWRKFYAIVENNIQEICRSFDSRWLVSIADTYADYGNDIEKRNALYISMMVNMEKLFATRLLMYDLTLNKSRVEALKSEEKIPLWDGLSSFNLTEGNMTNNLFRRLRSMLEETPCLENIFETVLVRIASNETILSDLNEYHNKLFLSHTKRKGIRNSIKRLKQLFRF